MIRVAHVVPSIENRAAGPSYSVAELCRILAEQDCQTALYILDRIPPGISDRVSVHRFDRWRFPHRLGVCPAMREALCEAARNSDVLHNHSLWMRPNIYPAQAIRGTACRLIVSPRGTVSPTALRRSQGIKWVAWHLLGQKEVMRAAACFHATAPHECGDIRRLGFRQPVAVIPNGIALPSERPPRGEGRKRLLFLGRLHPIKGLDILLLAWKRLARDFPEWELSLVGPDECGYESVLKNLTNEHDIPRVIFPGAVFGEELSKIYWSSELFVLPSRSENFGMAVAEALAHGLPAIVAKGAPWSGLEREGCGWWVDLSVDALAQALREGLRLSDAERESMGRKGRAWMQRDFSWDRIGGMMKKTYEWVLGGGDAPGWIEIQ